MIQKETYRSCLDYIENYWDKLIFSDPKSHLFLFSPGGHVSSRFGYIGLPKRGVSPNHTFFARSQFYWDSYFTILGLVVSGRIELARGSVENLCYLFEKYGIILPRNRLSSLGRTQPPFLSSMAFEIFEHDVNKDTEFLEKAIETAKKEYDRVWTTGRRFCADSGLSRYNPVVSPKIMAEYESGWDRSTRFYGIGQNLIPVDLNACLYKYESDFSDFAKVVGNNRDFSAEGGSFSGGDFWEEQKTKRQKLMDKFFWDEEQGFYFDYNLKTGKREALRTLAGFYPLWAGVASGEQARRCLENLSYFETSGGLANTEKIPWQKRQWDWPNGWPGQEYIVISGLKRYGFLEEAERIATKWLDLNKEIFEKTEMLWEKYDVVNRAVGLSGLYKTQSGFGWTNGVFVRLVSDFSWIALS